MLIKAEAAINHKLSPNAKSKTIDTQLTKLLRFEVFNCKRVIKAKQRIMLCYTMLQPPE